MMEVAMAPRTPLARYLTDALAARGESPEQFAQRIGVNSSGLYKLLRGEYTEPRQGTIEKIAAGLHMTAGELLTAVEPLEADPVEAAIRSRTAEMRQAIRDTPPELWGVIVRAAFDRAIDSARDMAQLVAGLADLQDGNSPPVTDPHRGSVTRPILRVAGRSSGDGAGLPDRKHCARVLMTAVPTAILAGV